MTENPFENGEERSVPKKSDLSEEYEKLRAREEELNRRQELLNQTQAVIIRTPNWPEFYPLIVYDPERDNIPQPAQLCVQHSFYGLVLLTIYVLFNIIAVLCVRGLDKFSHTRCFIFAVIQGFATVYIVLNYGYMRLYDSCIARDITFSWVVLQFCIIGWCTYLTIGFPESGSVGLATLLDMIAKSDYAFPVIVGFVNTALIGAATYYEFATLRDAQSYQKVSGVDESVPKAEI